MTRLERAHRRILVIDDDPGMCELLEMSLAGLGFEVTVASDRADVVSHLADDYDAAVVDIVLDHMSGLDVCRQIHETRPELPVLIMTAHGDSHVAIEAIRADAYDFIAKPFPIESLARILDRALEERQLARTVGQLRETVTASNGVFGLVGESPEIRELAVLLRRVASNDATVLITGESGTGKDLVARAIHECSPRARGPFLAFNCAAHETLLDAELFGHVKGAFTDARHSRPGLFVEASGGTLFLDEIADLPLSMQPKLLRVLQERKVRPLGADTEIPFDTRIVAATNRDLGEQVRQKRFREDLFYRIDVVRIETPPLRVRQGDVLLLSQHFLEQHRGRNGRQVSGLTPAAAQMLLDYDWPGNVRELENTIARAVTLTRFAEITVGDLPDRITSRPVKLLASSVGETGQLPRLEEVAASYIRRVLAGVDGNKTRAAEILGLNRRTLYRKVKRFNIDVSPTKAS